MPPMPQHLDSAFSQLGLSATLAINEETRRLEQAGKDIIRFGLGQSPFPVPDPVVEALRQHAAEKDYLAVAGLPALRQSIADYLGQTRRRSFAAEDIIVGPGSKELLFILQACYAATLLLPSPSWVSYAPQSAILKRELMWLPTKAESGWKLTASVLEEHILKLSGQPGILLLNSPNNPTGAVYSSEELQALATVARRHQVLVISDEIYGLVSHSAPFASISEHYPEGTVITDGLSKWSGAGGWRLGFAAFPAELSWLREAVAVMASESYTSVSAPIQHAAVTAFQDSPERQHYLAASNLVLSSLCRALAQRFNDAGIQTGAAAGGFYLFLDFSRHAPVLAKKGVNDGDTLTQWLLKEAAVATLPGSAFGRPGHELSLRLSYVDFDGAAVFQALQSFDHPSAEALSDAWLGEQCPRCLEGAKRLLGILDD